MATLFLDWSYGDILGDLVAERTLEVGLDLDRIGVVADGTVRFSDAENLASDIGSETRARRRF